MNHLKNSLGDLMQEVNNYKTLEKVALERGYLDAKVIPADSVVVEDRVSLRCMIGCPHYGKGLKCPPYTPSTEKFRKILNEYRFAMVVKIKHYKISEDLKAKYNIENRKEDSVRLWDEYNDADKMSSMIWADFSKMYRDSLMDLLELERAAFNMGYTLATAFFGGRCILCEKCDVESGICHNPMIARFAAEAVGINLIKTAENAGMELKFNGEGDPTPMAVLLID